MSTVATELLAASFTALLLRAGLVLVPACTLAWCWAKLRKRAASVTTTHVPAAARAGAAAVDDPADDPLTREHGRIAWGVGADEGSGGDAGGRAAGRRDR